MILYRNDPHGVLNNFTNHEFDEVLGLYFAKARFYCPVDRRFTQVDPARDGVNWYAYVHGNPLKYVDPSGLISTLPQTQPVIPHKPLPVKPNVMPSGPNIPNKFTVSTKMPAPGAKFGPWILIDLFRAGLETVNASLDWYEADLGKQFAEEQAYWAEWRPQQVIRSTGVGQSHRPAFETLPAPRPSTVTAPRSPYHRPFDGSGDEDDRRRDPIFADNNLMVKAAEQGNINALNEIRAGTTYITPAQFDEFLNVGISQQISRTVFLNTENITVFRLDSSIIASKEYQTVFNAVLRAGHGEADATLAAHAKVTGFDAVTSERRLHQFLTLTMPQLGVPTRRVY